MAALEASTCLRRTTRVATENRNRNTRKNLCGFSLRRVHNTVTKTIPTIAAIHFQYWTMSQVVVDLTLLFPLPGMLRVRSAAAHWLPRTFLLHGNLFSLFCSPHSSAPLWFGQQVYAKFDSNKVQYWWCWHVNTNSKLPPAWLHDLFSCTRKCAYAMCAHIRKRARTKRGRIMHALVKLLGCASKARAGTCADSGDYIDGLELTLTTWHVVYKRLVTS